MRIVLLLGMFANAWAFAPVAVKHFTGVTRLALSANVDESITSTTNSAADLRVPLTWDEMVRQTSSAIKTAAARGQKRQIARILLPRDASSNDFGKYIESNDDLAESTLVPPDESWQGGIMQLYRAASPTCEAIMRRVVQDEGGGVPPRVTEDRSVDESGVDGVGLLATEDGSTKCWLQPTQESIELILDDCKNSNNNNGLCILLNPQWRQVDDALDAYSKGEGFLSGLANFLGGKGSTLRALAEAGFGPVYTLEGYVCRGSNVRLLQVLDSDWAVFCERDDGESYLNIGSAKARPTYQEVEAMLDQSEIGYKYARDIGLQPKL